MPQQIYIVALKNRSDNYITKIGETEQLLAKRIVGFGFSGKWRRREKDVEIIETIATNLAPSLEKLVKKQLQRKWSDTRLMDKNLGRGYTEWYFMHPKTMQGIVHSMKKKLYQDDLFINYIANKTGEQKHAK